jgi:hypothetical protein
MEQGPGQPAPAPADRPRITTRYLTKYEKARVLGTRALQVRCSSSAARGGRHGQAAAVFPARLAAAG